MPATTRYPKPGEQGGRLIRRLVSFLRSRGLKLPHDSHILLAVSGGADSLALLRLLARYGRRIVDPSRLHVIHVNHGWRGEASREDARFVERACAELGVPLTVREIPTDYLRKKGESWEERARTLRKQMFAEEAARRGPGARVWTAHQADDLAETVLWRLFTGASDTHGAGILVESGIELRPLLFARRRELESFLEEERLSWLRDPANEDPRFMRARMRSDLLPVIEELFPVAVEHLTRMALEAQALRGLNRARPSQGEVALRHLEDVVRTAGVPLRRANWAEIKKQQVSSKSEVLVRLTEGWTLKRIRKHVQSGPQDLTERREMTRVKRPSRVGSTRERWILERTLKSTE